MFLEENEEAWCIYQTTTPWQCLALQSESAFEKN
jgi:hypothetical protein